MTSENSNTAYGETLSQSNRTLLSSNSTSWNNTFVNGTLSNGAFSNGTIMTRDNSTALDSVSHENPKFIGFTLFTILGVLLAIILVGGFIACLKRQLKRAAVDVIEQNKQKQREQLRELRISDTERGVESLGASPVDGAKDARELSLWDLPRKKSSPTSFKGSRIPVPVKKKANSDKKSSSSSLSSPAGLSSSDGKFSMDVASTASSGFK
ncbi:uncharacterized protein V2V93DRAFT_357891 [Kockiozyma suomiensis]|uniref:uncharacterized protein n=1 Tax=Kockiozyma suomiensis TaxID=1337062 RepID=UPI003343DCB1